MKNKKLFKKALVTLFQSWGMDTPDEVYWGCNDLLDWYEKEYNVNLGIRFERDEDTFESNFDEVIDAIDHTFADEL